MLASKFSVHLRATFLLACLTLTAVSAAVCGDESPSANDTNTKVEKPSDTAIEKLPNLKVRLLMVYRDWSSHNGEQLRKELEELFKSDQLPDGKRSIDDMLSVNSFLPKAGEAAVFKNTEFESLLQWLRARELVAEEQSVELQRTQFENRWTASIPRVTANQVWHMELDLVASNDPAMAGRVRVKRVHIRKSPAGGPLLRGASHDIRKEVSFFFPRDRAVVMSWYAHPQDSALLPNTEQQATEPILVFEVATGDEGERPAIEFQLPEKVIRLMLE